MAKVAALDLLAHDGDLFPAQLHRQLIQRLADAVSISSISSFEITSGGLKHSASFATARPITPFSSHSLVRRPPTFASGSKLRVARLVGDQFHRGDQPGAAHLAHQRVIGEAAAQFRLHVRPDRRRHGAPISISS